MTDKRTPRFRVTVTAVREYDADPTNYGTTDVVEMLKIDQQNLDEDPMLIIDHPNTEWKIKVENISGS